MINNVYKLFMSLIKRKNVKIKIYKVKSIKRDGYRE